MYIHDIANHTKNVLIGKQNSKLNTTKIYIDDKTLIMSKNECVVTDANTSYFRLIMWRICSTCKQKYMCVYKCAP